MNARSIGGMSALLTVVLWYGLSLHGSSCDAQDRRATGRHRSPRSLTIRAQEPEPADVPDVLKAEDLPRVESEEMEEPEEEEEEEEEHIETDRDSFTPATSLAGQGRSIVEAAYSFIDNRDTFETHSYPELLLRYGLDENIELRLGWNYEVGGAANPASGGVGGEEFEGPKLERESEFSYGLKVSLSKQEDWLPRSAFIAQGFTPTYGPDTKSDLVATYVLGWELPNHWELDAAMRYGLTNEEEDHFNQWAPSIVLKVPVAERWTSHVEYFAISTDGKEEERSSQYVSPGVHYLVTPDLEVGVRFGWGLNDDSARFFNNVGLGWRF